VAAVLPGGRNVTRDRWLFAGFALTVALGSSLLILELIA
jgi:hypothetical protein